MRDPDDDDAALAFQQELEAHEYNELFSSDAGYLNWLDALAAKAVYEQEYGNVSNCER